MPSRMILCSGSEGLGNSFVIGRISYALQLIQRQAAWLMQLARCSRPSHYDCIKGGQMSRKGCDLNGAAAPRGRLRRRRGQRGASAGSKVRLNEAGRGRVKQGAADKSEVLANIARCGQLRQGAAEGRTCSSRLHWKC